jgi:hypothetical protein
MEQNMNLAESLTAAVDEKSEVGRLLQNLLSNPFQLHALRVLLGVQTNAALPAVKPYPADHAGALEAAGVGGTSAAAAATDATTAAAAAGGGDGVTQGAGGAEPGSYQIARDVMESNGEFGSEFESSHKVVRLSMKLLRSTPADLPPDLRQQLMGWLAEAPVGLEAYIRPGCVMLTAHITVHER